MHNVLLRNAKHLMVLWKDNKTITEIHFSSIQCVVDKFVTPADIWHIPYKISSGFSALAADKWKNLTIEYAEGPWVGPLFNSRWKWY